MAIDNKKITELSSQTGANVASGDLFPFVDVSDTSMDSTGTTKILTNDEIKFNLWPDPYTYRQPAIGDYFQPQWLVPQASGAVTLNLLNYLPIFIGQALEVDTIVFRSNTGVGSSFLRTGIYTSSQSGKPDVLLVDASQVAATSTNTTYSAGFSSLLLSPGLYYIAAVGQGVAPNLILTGDGVGNSIGGFIYGSSTDYAWYNGHNWSQSGVSGSLPSSATPVPTFARCPTMGLRRSA